LRIRHTPSLRQSPDFTVYFSSFQRVSDKYSAGLACVA
jgi:hypothetical protein